MKLKKVSESISESISESPRDDPALVFLYRRIEETLGIRAAPENLRRLQRYLADRCGTSGRPELYEKILGNREELRKLSPLVTVNETYFFREGIHFRLLARRLLPRLFRLGRPLRICSAATSSGCEAYSIAMVADFLCRAGMLRYGEDSSRLWTVDAFDLNPEMIAAAAGGVYGPGALREDGSGWKFLTDLYLRRGDRGLEISETLRAKIHFFTHNIMEGLPGPYDIIFFRNALIYFSPANRRKVLAVLRNALAESGTLVVGLSETSMIGECGLGMVHRMGAFYFTRRSGGPEPEDRRPVSPAGAAALSWRGVSPGAAALAGAAAGAAAVAARAPAMAAHRPGPGAFPPRPAALAPFPAPARNGGGGRDPAQVGRIARILEREEGRPNAERVLDLLWESGGAETPAPDKEELTAAVITLMNGADLPLAGLVLSRLEDRGSSPATSFLRGEFYYYYGGKTAAAEGKYQEAAAGDLAFWPALYRMSSLAEQGNRARYLYRLKKALESMERGEGRGYEIFIGGFSPDYYRRILEKKLAE